jgi:hypothetical protein
MFDNKPTDPRLMYAYLEELASFVAEQLKISWENLQETYKRNVALADVPIEQIKLDEATGNILDSIKYHVEITTWLSHLSDLNKLALMAAAKPPENVPIAFALRAMVQLKTQTDEFPKHASALLEAKSNEIRKKYNLTEVL